MMPEETAGVLAQPVRGEGPGERRGERRGERPGEMAGEMADEGREEIQGEMQGGMPGETRAAAEELRRRAERRPIPFATMAFWIAAVLLIAEGVAVYLANTGSPAAATVMAQILMGVTVVPFGLGVFAAVRGPRRTLAFAAMIVSVIANPFVLLQVLSFFEAL